MSKILVTGGAGYIGSLLTGMLLSGGHEVTVVDSLLHGGDSLLAYVHHPRFRFHRADVAEAKLDSFLRGVHTVFHLAAIVGFPACQQVGEIAAFRGNTDAVANVFEAADRMRVQRFVFASTYSNYGVSLDGPVTEESPLQPQSLYARTKVAAETWLVERGRSSQCAAIVPRFATVFGVSPRTRFDLIVNQFVLQAFRQRRLLVYEGDYFRSFVHVRDIVDALLLLMASSIDLVRNQVFNVGSEAGNYSKRQIVDLIRKHIEGVSVEYREMSLNGDMRDVQVSFEKVRSKLGFAAKRGVEDGIAELVSALESGMIADPGSPRYRNHAPMAV